MEFEEFKRKYQKIPVEEYPNRVLELVPEPVVTCRVITYQHANYIAHCLEGIIKQKTSFPIEIIVGEDGSTDGTREICIDFAQKYPEKIRLFLNSRENNILLEGRETGRFNAFFTRFISRGQYVAFCEGDDYWTDPQKIEKQYQLMRENRECFLSFHPVWMSWGEGDENRKVYKKHKNQNYIFPVEKIIYGGGEFCPTNSLMIKKEALALDEWLIEFPVGDYYSQILAAMNGGALYIDEIMGVYRKNVPGSWSSKHDTFYDACKHSILMCKSNRMFDEISGYRFHKDFMKRENYLLKKHGVFKTYDYDKNTIEKVKSLLNKHTTGTLKLKCYSYLLFSFLYYRLKVRRLLELKNRMK